MQTDAEAKRLQRTIWTAAAAIVLVLAVYGIVQVVTFRQQMEATNNAVKHLGEVMDKVAPSPLAESTPAPLPDWPSSPR